MIVALLVKYSRSNRPGRHMFNPKSTFGISTSASFKDYFAAAVASHRCGFVLAPTTSGEITDRS